MGHTSGLNFSDRRWRSYESAADEILKGGTEGKGERRNCGWDVKRIIIKKRNKSSKK